MLLESICQLIRAQNGTWLGVVRVGAGQADDPMNGWRPHSIHFLHSDEGIDNTVADQVRKLDSGEPDDVGRFNAQHMGEFRVNLLSEMVSEQWFDSDHYKLGYLALGHQDAIMAWVPMSEDAEVCFVFFRDKNQPEFTEAEKDLVNYTLRGLRWFHKQQMLGHGLLLADTPLTATERSVLELILQGLSEKHIAEKMGKSYFTIHDHVTKIFRKFGVNSRPSLHALWFSDAGAQTSEEVQGA